MSCRKCGWEGSAAHLQLLAQVTDAQWLDIMGKQPVDRSGDPIALRAHRSAARVLECRVGIWKREGLRAQAFKLDQLN